jgi:hypothetical protein
LSIGAVLAATFGLALGLLPVQFFSALGVAAPVEAQITVRDHGVTLLGVGIIN